MAVVKTRLAMEWGLVKAGERVCVAVSGGADSTALLAGLCEANVAKTGGGLGLGIVVSAAHVHHGLRGADADADEAFVRELCGRLEVHLQVFRVDTAERMASRGEGLEEAARGLRYGALQGLMEQGLVDVVATGHTLDDQAETVMMKLLRGAWTEGLGGISPLVQREAQGTASRVQGSEDGRIIRPMLGVRRTEIEAFLRVRGMDWREDASNRDVTLTRNRVRHELMPLLREFNPNVDTALARTAEIAREEEAFWAGEVARVLPQVLLPGRPVRGGGRAVGTAVGEASSALEIGRLQGMAGALRRRVVRAAARSVGARLGAEETAKVLALAGFGGMAEVTGRSGSRLELRGGLRVERSAREVRFWKQG